MDSSRPGGRVDAHLFEMRQQSDQLILADRQRRLPRRHQPRRVSPDILLDLQTPGSQVLDRPGFIRWQAIECRGGTQEHHPDRQIRK